MTRFQHPLRSKRRASILLVWDLPNPPHSSKIWRGKNVSLSRTPCFSRLHIFNSPGCVVALTGAVDWVSDGTTVVKLMNGHRLLGDITGSGCVTGTCIATFCAGACEVAKNENGAAKLVRGDMLLGAVGG